MKVRHHLWLLVAAGLLAQAGCSSDEPRAPADEPRNEPPFVRLIDNDADLDQIAGEAGAYAMTARGHEKSAPLAVVDVPEGFSNFGAFAMWPQDVAAEIGEPYQAIQYWTVYGVHPDPCRHRGAAPEIGGSVADLAGALETQQVTTMSSVPQQVSLDGHAAVYVEVTIPNTIDFGRCGEGYLQIWDGVENDSQHAWNEPGLDRLWIVDVDGVRVVLLASTSPDATDAQADALEDIITSVRFVKAT
jgi:hypothetical protein